jgi:serine phosphatase RsbU (regulator of sigma subunit)/putative methionine-R-sulfoxide reductase with GAF domain
VLIKGLRSPFAPSEAYYRVGIVDLAALLLFGPVGGAWVAASGALINQLEWGILEILGARREDRSLSWSVLLGNMLYDSGLKIVVSLGSGWFYTLIGGQIPPLPLEPALVLPIALLVLGWFLLDHLGWAIAEAALRGWRGLQAWFRSSILPALLVDLLPLPLALLVVLAYREQSWMAFGLVAVYLLGTSMVIQQLFSLTQRQQRAAQELVALNEVAQAIVQAELSVEGLCDLIYEQASRVVDTSSFHLGLFEQDRFTLKIHVREGVRQDPLTVTLAPGEGIVGWMKQSKKPLLVQDFLREMDRLPARPTYLSDRPPRSAVFVPLMVGQDVIGSLSIQSPRPFAFSEQHLRMLSFIADQSSLAIAKARLYQAAQDRAVDLEHVARENAALYTQVREERDRLELVYDVARDLTRRLDLDNLLRRLIQRTVDSVQAADGTIVLLGDRRVPPRAICLCEEPGASPEEVLENGLAGWVIRSQESVVLADVQEDPRWLPVERPVGSAIAVPIMHQKTPLGVLTLTHPQVDFFTQADATLLQAIAEHSAVALEAARLYEAQRRRAVQMQTIAQVMRTILSILDLDQLLSRVVNLVRDRFGYAHIHLFTMDASGEEALFRASTDPESPFWTARDGRAALDEGLVGWVATHGDPVIVGDVRMDDRWLPDQRGVRSEIAVPLKFAGEIVGVLDVQSEEPYAFDAEDLFILRTLANQLAVALESARRYAAEQEEAWVLNALLQAAQNIAQAHELDDLLGMVVRLIPLLVGVDCCCLFLRERDTRDFEFSASYGVSRGDFAGEIFSLEQVPAFERVVKQAGPVALFAEAQMETLPPTLSPAIHRGGVWLFPLLVGGEVSGILALGMEAAGAYLSGRQHTIVSGIAQQAGIAIEEARLRGEAVERQRMEQELAVAREIQQRFLPESLPDIPGWSITASWQSAREVGGDFYDFIDLPDGRLGVVIADVSDKGVPAAMFMSLTRSMMRASAISHFLPGEALLRVNRLLLEYTRGEMFVTLFYGILDPHTGEMHYASAGHNPSVLCHSDGRTELLEAKGVILGVLEQASLDEKTVQLEPGNLLVLYTDGITEAIDLMQNEYGLDRLRAFVSEHRFADLELVQESLLEEVASFSQGQPPFDDLTLVLLRRTGSG